MARVRTVKSFLTYSSGSPFQGAVALGLGLPTEFFTSIADTLRRKRDLLSEGLLSAGLTVNQPQGGYFLTADTSAIGVTDATTFARQLPELVGVAAIPVPVFCHADGAVRTRSLLRFAFCKRFDVLEDAAARLSTLRRKL